MNVLSAFVFLLSNSMDIYKYVLFFFSLIGISVVKKKTQLLLRIKVTHRKRDSPKSDRKQIFKFKTKTQYSQENCRENENL